MEPESTTSDRQGPDPALVLLVLSGVAGCALQLVFAMYLPETVATHFGASGVPDDWMPLGLAVAVWALLHLFFTAMFLAIPYILRISPIRIVSLPKRAYWLAPERKDASLKVIGRWFYVFGVAMNSFFIATGYLSFRANLATPVRLDTAAFTFWLVAFLAFTVAWTVAFLVRFSKTPSSSDD